jgi:hypothetical protein
MAWENDAQQEIPSGTNATLTVYGGSYQYLIAVYDCG